jgi:predicted NBD/HSP70 family sugar kinase/mannose-6-phosphate isomerase class I
MCRHTDKHILGVDIGGSHVAAALVNAFGEIVEQSLCKRKLDAKTGNAGSLLKDWIQTMRDAMSKLNAARLQGVGIAMPGPFDYTQGISRLEGLDKYESLYGINIKAAIVSALQLEDSIPVLFENDASCFGLGAGILEKDLTIKNVLAITLGTGFGAAFIRQGKIMKQGSSIPENGYLYNIPFKEGIAEDYISARWLLNDYHKRAGVHVRQVKELAALAIDENNEQSRAAFSLYGANLATCLAHWLRSFEADALIIGGNISKAACLFMPELKRTLHANEGIELPIIISENTELAAITGAAALISTMEETKKYKPGQGIKWRKSSQQLLPAQADQLPEARNAYDMYPFQRLEKGTIFSGYDSLADWIIEQRIVAIDGFIGNDWAFIQKKLDAIFRDRNLRVLWYETSAFRKTEREIDELVTPFLGEPDSVWGSRTTLELEDFYQMEKLKDLQPASDFDVSVVIGIGAGLCEKEMPLIYVDLPKNELQYRMRAGSICNLGASQPDSPGVMYKRFYFVDWVVLNKYRRQIRAKISVVADGQWKDTINWTSCATLSEGLQSTSTSIIRVRPWFEAGAWGGQWMKEHFPSLNQNEINYAWSFELIVPENGLVFESDGHLLEVAFDWLMEECSANVLGKDAARFGDAFPIRFDFLDTFQGGNLSIQCHPSLKYIQQHFGETITQDETYYILDCKQDAGVYLGFVEDIEPDRFRTVLEESEEKDCPVNIKKYVQWHPAHKHDLFLIPNGTVHSSGVDNLVLEISATPYIFTFKMYDWVRLDLEGNPRPINIEHAFNNLNFDRRGKKVEEELICRPSLIEKNHQYTLIHLPTHKEHFYDVHRIEFDEMAEIRTEGKCHILMLVEGSSVTVEAGKGQSRRFHYAETFIIPAAAGSYKLINENGKQAKLIKAFIK